jgi:uncharacterized membrane protein
VNYLWRRGEIHTGDTVAVGQIVLSLVSLLVLAVSGFLGGMLAYRYGVRVADEATQSEGYEMSTPKPPEEESWQSQH